MNGNYDEQDKEKLCPLDIMIQNENGKIGIIEPDLNIALNEDNMGSANNEKYIYFSFVSNFSWLILSICFPFGLSTPSFGK